jgi:hypothetical protein
MKCSISAEARNVMLYIADTTVENMAELYSKRKVLNEIF